MNGSSRGRPRPTESETQMPAKPSFSTVVPKSVSQRKPEASCWFSTGLAIIAMPSRIRILLRQPHDLGERFDVLDMAAHRIEEQMVRTGIDQRFELFAHLLGRAVNFRVRCATG